MTNTTNTLICPKCGELASPNARFCERDGTRLVASETVPAIEAKLTTVRTAPDKSVGARCRCGAGPEDKDNFGFCQSCGRRWPDLETAQEGSRARDRIELELSPNCAAITDRGLRHGHNQDDVAILESGNDSFLVVCDGVSTAYESAAASRAATVVVLDHLRECCVQGVLDPALAMSAALNRAHRAVCELHRPMVPASRESPPATTVVAAWVRNGTAIIGWLGDSRAYWIGVPVTNGALPVVQQLTRDHSWLNEMTAAGLISETEGARSHLSHAITRYLGPEEAGKEEMPEPEIISFTFPGSGYLLLCSDGLWNYAPTSAEMAEIFRESGEDGFPRRPILAVCQRVVNFVLERGARDNVSVAIRVIGGESLPESGLETSIT